MWVRDTVRRSIVNTVVVALRSYKVDIPLRNFTYGELTSWIQSRINQKDRRLLEVLSNKGTMGKLERMFDKSNSQVLFQNLLGRHQERARELMQKGTTQWTQRLDQDYRQRVLLTKKDQKTPYGVLYQQVLKGNKKAIEWVFSEKGIEALRKQIVRETGSYHAALEGIRNLHREALQRGSITGGSRGMEEKLPIAYKNSQIPHRGVYVRSEKEWYLKVKDSLLKKVREGKGVGDYFKITKAMQNKFNRLGLSGEYQNLNKELREAIIQENVKKVIKAHTKKEVPDTSLELKNFAKRNWEVRRAAQVLGRSGNMNWYTSKEYERIVDEWMTRKGKRTAGDAVIPFGKFKGKSLQWIFDNKPYYIAFLDAHISGENISKQRGFDRMANIFLESAAVKNYLKTYYEDYGSSSPRDLMPYYEQRRGKKYIYDYETQLSWRDSGIYRQGGFATSDAWTKSRIDPRGLRVYQAVWNPQTRKWEAGGAIVMQSGKPEFTLINEMGEVIVGGLNNYGLRRKEQRVVKEFDPDYFISLERKEMMDVVGKAYTGKDIQEKLRNAVKMAPWMAVGMYERLIRFTESAHKFFRDKSLKDIEPLDHSLFGLKDVVKGQKASLRRGVYDPEQEGALATLDTQFLNYRTLNKLNTREELINWYNEFGEKVGWDVAKIAGPLYGKDIKADFMERWNRVVGK